MAKQVAQFPSTFYRVSLKAIIRNGDGDILVNKEAGRGDWSLPGGGWDHGETKIECMKRELSEEIGYQGDLIMNLVGVSEPVFMPTKQNWLIWVVYDVFTENNNFSIGGDSDEICFIDPEFLAESTKIVEKLTYKFSSTKK